VIKSCAHQHISIELFSNIFRQQHKRPTHINLNGTAPHCDPAEMAN
jgi:hypothetical protein